MVKKRKSGGSKNIGSGMVTCSSCSRLVPRGKAKKHTRVKSLVDPVIGRELRKAGASISRSMSISYMCISCAVHRGVAGIRSASERKVARPPRRF